MQLLVIDAYDPDVRAALPGVGCTEAGRLYAAAIGDLDDSIELEILRSAGAQGPQPGRTVSEYDGIVWTGSNLTIHRPTALVDFQLDLARQAFSAGVPQFGSCWALHVATVAAGGRCARNPKGREFGIAREIETTSAGREHPILAGRKPRYEALASHEDMVVELPAGALLLAKNAFSGVQAADIRHERGRFWAVQYHPEYHFGEIAGLSLMRREQLVREGRFSDAGEAERFTRDYRALHHDSSLSAVRRRHQISDRLLSSAQRRLEIANWLGALRTGELRS